MWGASENELMCSFYGENDVKQGFSNQVFFSTEENRNILSRDTKKEIYYHMPFLNYENKRKSIFHCPRQSLSFSE